LAATRITNGGGSSPVEDWAVAAAAEVTGWPEDLKPTTATEARAMGLFLAALDTERGL